jgi:archaellum component FlaC
MSSIYPDAIDGQEQIPLIKDRVTAVNAASVNSIRSAVLNIEGELGVSPKGSFATVRQRLDSLEDIVNGLNSVDDQILEINSRLDIIDGDIITIDGNIDIISSSIDTINSDILLIQQDIDNIIININTLSGDIDGINSNLLNCISNLKSKIENIPASNTIFFIEAPNSEIIERWSINGTWDLDYLNLYAPDGVSATSGTYILTVRKEVNGVETDIDTFDLTTLVNQTNTKYYPATILSLSD